MEMTCKIYKPLSDAVYYAPPDQVIIIPLGMQSLKLKEYFFCEKQDRLKVTLIQIVSLYHFALHGIKITVLLASDVKQTSSESHSEYVGNILTNFSQGK